MQESVLIVDRAKLFSQKNFQGFLQAGEHDFFQNIAENFRFEKRNEVESNPAIKQIIPYNILLNGSKVFLYWRKAKQTDERSKEKYSVGMGGHINDTDKSKDFRQIIENGRRRELKEEVDLKNGESELVGFINDESDSFNSVHFGLVYLVKVNSNIKIKEEDIMEGQFVEIKDLGKYFGKMERWSQLVCENLLGR